MMKRRKSKLDNFKRTNRHTILFNTPEYKAIDHFCSKFRIKNRSKFMREAIITEVLKKFDANYPTLFEDNQLRLF
jgi:hypothetical protein